MLSCSMIESQHSGTVSFESNAVPLQNKLPLHAKFDGERKSKPHK